MISFGASKYSRVLRWLTPVAIVGLLLLGPVSLFGATQDFFDWHVMYSPSDPTVAPVSGPGFQYVPTPYYTGSNLNQVMAYLDIQAGGSSRNARENPAQPLAIKIDQNLNASQLAAIFNTYKVSWVFLDMEGSTDAQIAATVADIKKSTYSSTAAIGEYNYTPNSTDPSTANGSHTSVAYRNTGLTMVNEALYPGSSGFKNPAYGNSTAPSILSAFFTMPIERLSTIQTTIAGTGQQNIPYVARFNNWGVSAMTTQGDPLGQFVAEPGHVTQNGLSADNQLLSRNDFSALILQYRMRGATSFHLLDGGIVGYTQAQQETDAETGWFLPQVQSIFSMRKTVIATDSTTITLKDASTGNVAKTMSLESAGVVWSGVEGSNSSTMGDGSKLAILISNLSDQAHTIVLPTKLSGVRLSQTTFNVLPDQHILLTFTENTGMWALQGGAMSVFNNAALNSHEGIGIPEPTAVSLLTLSALGVLIRRRRRA